MFNIQLIQSAYCEHTKWILWKKNLGKKYLSHLIDFSETTLDYHFNKSDGKMRSAILHLIQDESHLQEHTRIGRSEIRQSDLFRKFNLNEYRQLSKFLIHYGYKYNKKKDEFIKVK